MLRRIHTRFSVQVGAAILLAVAVAGAVSFWRVLPAVGEDTDRRFTDLVTRASMQTGRQVEALQSISLAAAGVLSAQPDFASSLMAGNLPGALGVATTLAAEASDVSANGTGSAGGMTIYSRDGQILLRTHDLQNRVPATVPEMVDLRTII